jgi:hypothetical protein
MHNINYGGQIKATAMVNHSLTVVLAVKATATVNILTMTVPLRRPPWLKD